MKYWITGIVLVALDIISKYAAESFLHENSITLIPEFFHLTLAFNEGVAFSLAIPKFIQIFITLAFLIYFFLWAGENFLALSKGERWGSILLVSGAIGNFLDRIFSGHVIDFLSVHYQNIYYFPIFNLADIAIFCGVMLWLVGSWHTKKIKKKKREE